MLIKRDNSCANMSTPARLENWILKLNPCVPVEMRALETCEQSRRTCWNCCKCCKYLAQLQVSDARSKLMKFICTWCPHMTMLCHYLHVPTPQSYTQSVHRMHKETRNWNMCSVFPAPTCRFASSHVHLRNGNMLTVAQRTEEEKRSNFHVPLTPVFVT